MDTISAFERDVFSQEDLLRNFVPRTPIPQAAQKRSVFCGSGDSLAAAMLAESFSGGLVRSADPLDIVQNRGLSAGRTLYPVSISGGTVSNIRAARTAPDSVAITADGDSRLAKACSRTILLEYRDSGTFTAGSVGFLASALTCISLVSGARIPRTGTILESARRDAAGSRLSGNVFVLGDFLTYPVAMYCTAKLCEILGGVSQYERIEQFSHMGLFSARPGDTVLVFGGGPAHGLRLAGNLEGAGLNVIRPRLRGDRVRQILYLVFFSQFLALGEARSRGLRDCHFVTAKGMRDASSAMIY